ncbi:MAG: YunG family protein [archaeon]
MDIKTLQLALLDSWNSDTCYPLMEKDWSSKNAAYGQCYVTALIVNDYLGGKILKTKFEDGTGHFWNLIENKEVDLTRSQFNKDKVILKPTIHSREEIENNPKYHEYNQRYLILKKRVEEFLKIR